MSDAKYRITNASPRPTFGKDNKPLDVYDVSFIEESSGFAGMVQIPVNQFTAEKVHELVQPVANNLAATAQLGQG